MNKIIIPIVVLSVLVSATPAFASTCGNPALNHAEVTTVDPITSVVTVVSPAVNNVSCEGTNPENVVSAWGYTNSQLPNHKAGTSFTTISGRVDYCPLWFGLINCVDISGTQYFQSRWGK